MKDSGLIGQVVNTWNVHNKVNLYLIGEIPAAGLKAVPANSRGRTVAEQLLHMNRVRLGWLHYHKTSTRPKLPPVKGARTTKAQLRKAFLQSGQQIEVFLRKALKGESAPRAIGKQAMRWLGYLISHESRHRGQIMLALRQNGMRLPENVSVQGLWGKWIWGK